MTPGSIIDALGGTGEVADALSLSLSTVSGWRTRPNGIPAPHWSALIRIAAAKGVDIRLETLAELAAEARA